MSIIGKLLKTSIDVVTIPASMGLDIITMGGELTDRKESYTVQHGRCIVKDAEKLLKEIEDI